ncbi:MAG: MBG domain-containing protein [Acidimicrobiales bacterium]
MYTARRPRWCRLRAATAAVLGTWLLSAVAGTLGSAGVAASAPSGGAVTVRPAALSVSGPTISVTYGAGFPGLGPTYAGFVHGDSAASLSEQASCSTTATATSPPGPYAVTCSGAVDPDYQISYVLGTLTVLASPSGVVATSAPPAPDVPVVPVGATTSVATRPVLTVKAPDMTVSQGSSVPALLPSYSGFVDGANAASLTSQATCRTTAVAGSPVGTYPVSCAGASDPKYLISYLGGTVTVVALQGGTRPADVTSGGSTLAPTADGRGWWVLSKRGRVSSFGTAPLYGAAAAGRGQPPPVAIAASLDSGGYWLATARGDVYSFGDARFYGSALHLDLAGPVVAIARTANGKGYWLATARGSVYSFGDARSFGSLESDHVAGRMVAIAPTGDGHGYWLVSRRGAVYAFGDAVFEGCETAPKPKHPVTGIIAYQGGTATSWSVQQARRLSS